MSFSRPTSLLSASAGASSSIQMIRGANVHSEDGKPELSEIDMVVFLGDFNYRLHSISYDEARDFVSQRCFDWLWERDQLRAEMKAGKVFQGMREGQIRFPPTYKFERHQPGLAGAILVALNKGPPIKFMNWYPSTQMEVLSPYPSPADDSKLNWVKGTLVMLSANTAWSLWLVLQVEMWVDPACGQSTGRIKRPDSLLRAVSTLVNCAQVNAIAVVGHNTLTLFFKFLAKARAPSPPKASTGRTTLSTSLAQMQLFTEDPEFVLMY